MLLLRYFLISLRHFSIVFVLSLFLISLTFADTGPGLKVGMYFPDGMSVEGSITRDFDTTSGLTVGVDYVFSMTDVLFIRPEIDYSSFANGADDGVKLLDIGVDILYQLDINNYTIRPYLGIAYGLGEFEIASIG